MKEKIKNEYFSQERWKLRYDSDWVFHYVYGQNTKESKSALIAFLNVILARKEDPIKELEIMNPVNYRQFPTDKETTLDIKALTKNGDLIDIELQNGNLDCYQNRSLMYGGKLLNSSLEKGQNYDKMKKSIVISIVTGKLFPHISDLHTVFHLWEDAHRELLSDRLELHYIELGKVKKDVPVEMLGDVERLAAYLKYAADCDAQEYLKELIESGEEVIRLSEKRMERASEDFYARMRQIDIEMREHDIATARYIKELEEAERKKKELEQRQQLEELKADAEKARAEMERIQFEIDKAKADRERFNRLVSILAAAGRVEDLKRSAADPAFAEQLYCEFDL